MLRELIISLRTWEKHRQAVYGEPQLSTYNRATKKSWTRTKPCGSWREGWGMEKLFCCVLACVGDLFSYFICMYVCICIFVCMVCTYMFIHVHVHMWLCVHVDFTVECLPYHPPPYCLSLGLYWPWSPEIELDWRTNGLQRSAVLLGLSIPSAEVRMPDTTPGFMWVLGMQARVLILM